MREQTMKKSDHDDSRSRGDCVPASVLESILNEMKSYLYVSDIQTGVVLYANERLQRDYGAEMNLVGLRCWEVLRKAQQRCVWCPVAELEQNPAASVEWEEYEESTGRYYRNTDSLIDWPGGNKAHMHHRVDVTDIRVGAEELKKRFRQQELMAAITRGFITTEETGALIHNALRMSGEFMGASKMLIAKLNRETSTLDTEYFWSHPDQEVFRPEKTRFPFHPGAREYGAYIVNKLPYLVFEDISREESLAHLTGHGIKALVEVPVYIFGSFWGLFAISDCQRTRAWTASDIHLAEHISAIISGVIERSITEQDLARMSSIVNGAPQLVCYLDQAGRFRYFNPGALKILGYAERELINKDLSFLLDEKSGEHFREVIWPKLRKQGSVNFEYSLKIGSGEKRIMSFSAFITDFEALGVGLIGLDITEKRQMGKELLSAKEDAIRSSVAKSEFLSRMSHEIRTPLSAIIGMTGIARASCDEEKREYCLEKIDDASKHLLGVINDVLDISKIESGKLELAETEFSVEDMLRRILNVVQFRVEEKKQELIISIDPDIPASLVADEQRLAQVLANLLSNAVKFTPDGGVITVSLRLLEEKDGLCALRLAVKDTGIGLTEEQKGNLFQSFAQADGTISRRFGGTGLGLAISKRIVDLMGGAIWVESVANEGTTFFFTISVLRGSGRTSSPVRRAGDLAGLRILVADPSSAIRAYFMELGKTLSLRCYCARNMGTALDMLAGNPYDVVFLDWNLAGEDGVRSGRAAAAAVPFIVMSPAVIWSDIAERAKEAGASDYVCKPLFASKIIRSIRNCLGYDVSLQDGKSERALALMPGCFAGRRLLLAEDIEVNREIVITLLQETGVAIDCARDGKEACERFARVHAGYDLIFMDLHMPEVDGHEATRQIRNMEEPGTRRVPIIAMTASVFKEDIDRCLAVGMDDHIGKPINTEELFNKVRLYLS